MTFINRSWMVQFFLFITLSSVKIQKITQHNVNFKYLAPHIFNFEASFSGANAMAMQVSMQFPMKDPPIDFSGFGAPVNNPRRVFISSLPEGGPFGPAIPLPIIQPQQQHGQHANRPQICHCGQQHNIPTNQFPPPQYNPPQQPLCCQNVFQQPPQQPPQHPQCCQNPVRPPQQLPCCQDHFEPPQQRPPCCHNQIPVMPPGHGPNQFPLPGHNMAPVAQVVLTPNVGRCSNDESDDSDDESDSDESDDCTQRCHEKVARMNAERKDIGLKKHRRMNNIKKHSKSKRRSNHGESKVKPLQPVLQYVTKNGDVKYNTKISNDAALDLFGDYFIEPKRKRRKQMSTRRVFSFEEGSHSPANVRVIRAGNSMNFNDVSQQEALIADKTHEFDLQKKNNITNLSLTFLFS